MIIFKTTAYFNPHLDELCFFEEKEGITKKLVSALEPSNKKSGPVDLFCLCWAICFYKTSKKILAEQNYTNKDLKVKVTLEMQKDDKGFYFKPTAILGIQDMTLEQTEIIADSTHKRCPISRLISADENVSVKVANYNELITE
ncbi:OsmC family protein [Candidatus Phytoplasma tritici]|uniref:OsmC family protein n=1 Tax=Candidatus Phytoplasma tritici TaxID=321961 RepID=UPI0004149716|nr:OsmC family protein [Candidatus Phytoplasma tritici]